MNKKINTNNTNLVFEELEPRLLLSADGLAVITESSVATLHDLVNDNNEHTLILQEYSEQSSVAVNKTGEVSGRTELVIIDSRAPNFQQLHNDVINAQQQGRDINVVILDAHRDGIQQISDAISQYNKLDAVHIVSHGKDAQLELGATQLNKQNLKQRSEEIAQWKDVFTDGGDLLIYGCNLAESSDGTVLVNSLSKITGADVAASDDLTGNTILGGDWDLEYKTGDIESSLAFSTELQENWQGVLSTDTQSNNEQQALIEEQEAQAVEQQEIEQQAELNAALLAEEQVADEIHLQQVEQQASEVEEQRQEFVFIDESVTDYQSFIDDLQNRSDTSTVFEIIVLDSDANGIEQIANVLSAYDDVDAVHIFSHGSDGAVKLGNAWLNADNINQYGDSLAAWGSSLDENADILIYGCNLTETANGEQFVDTLAHLTGADVAASDDLTGQVDYGGDWDLEFATGSIESTVAISAETQQNWNGLLAETVYESQATVNDNNEIKSDQAWGQTFSHSSGAGTYTVNTLSLELMKDSDAGTQTITVSLRSSWGGPVLGSVTISTSEFTSTGAYNTYSFNFADVSLIDGNTYYIRVDSNTATGKVYVGSNSSGGYSNGDLINKDGNAESGKDLAFVVAAVVNEAPTFAPDTGDGIVTTDVTPNSDLAYSVTTQADGKILVAGVSNNGTSTEFVLIRYNTDGSLDTSFDGDGIVTTDISANNDAGFSVTVQADGKILLAGNNNNGTSTEFVLVRYNIDGSLDTSFDGDGIVTTDISANPDGAQSVTVQSDGKILVAGSSDTGTSSEFALIRYNSDGSLDTSFDSDGIVTTNITANSDAAYSITLQNDGKILLAGSSDNGSSSAFAITRYNSDGSLDTSFDGDGIVTTDIVAGGETARSVTVQTDGKILVAGYGFTGSGAVFALTRYNTDGSLDTSFDSPGSLNGTPTFIVGGSPVVLDADVVVSDPELTALDDFTDSYIWLLRNGGANAEDIFTATGNLAVLTEGGNLVLSGATIGTVDTNSSGELRFVFGNNATNAQVNETLQSIAYSNSSGAPSASVQIDWIFNDGNTGAQGSGGAGSAFGNTTVSITGINNAPINTVPSAQTTNEDTALIFNTANANLISISDADIGGNDLVVSLSVNDGILTLSGTTGINFIGSSNGSAVMTFSGTLTNINNALDGLSFNPDSNFNGAVTLQMTTHDEATLLGHYSFDLSGDLGNDSSGAGNNDGVVNGAAPPAIPDPAPRDNTLQFDGSVNDHVQINGRFGDSANVTLAAWVNLTASGTFGSDVISLGDDVILRFDQSSGNVLRGSYYDSVALNWVHTNFTVNLVSTGWHHIAYTVDDTSKIQKLYLDGVEVGSNISTGSILYNTHGTNSFIGTHGDAAVEWDFTGQIDDARVYDRALTSQEIIGLASNALIHTDSDTVAITVNAVNDAPNVFTSVGALNYTEQNTTVIDSAVSITDIDNTQLTSATVSITSGFFSSEDSLNFTDQFGITGSYDSGTGILTLSGTTTISNYIVALRSITYHNNSDAPNTTTRTISFIVNDGTDNSVAATRDITINPVNDVPTATNSFVVENYTEDTPIDLTDIVVSDVDNSDVTVTLTLSDSAAGSLSTATSGSVTSTFSGGVWSASGAISDVNSLLAGVIFTPTLNYNTTFNIVINVDDGVATIVGNKIMLGAAANDAPVNTVPVSVTVTEEVVTAISGILITDVDANGANLTTRLQINNGSLTITLVGSATISAGANGSNDVTILGTVTDINATLASLTYTGDTDVTGINADTLTITTNDGGNTGSGGPLQDVDTVQININNVNDAPTATNLSAAESYTEDTVLDLTNIIVNDVDDANVIVTLTLSDVTAGALSTATSNAVTSTFVGGVWTASGVIADVNILLAGVTFNPTLNYNSNFTITTSVEDGVAPAVTGIKVITGTVVNDAPIINTSNPVFINEIHYDNVGGDVGEAIELAGKAGTDLTGWVLALYNGTTSNVYNTIALSGVFADQSNGYGVQTFNYAGIQNGPPDGLALVDDLGTVIQFISYEGTITASGGPAAGMISTDIGVSESGSTPVGDSLQLTGAGPTYTWAASAANTFGSLNTGQSFASLPQNTVQEDSLLVFSAANNNAITVSDVDASAGSPDPMLVTLSVSNGVITLGSTTGLTSLTGNGSGAITFRGSVSEVNTALDGLNYQGNANFNGADSLNILVDDQGNAGSGGALFDSDNVAITVTAVNDAPTATNLNAAESYTEDTVLNLTDIVVSDVDSANVTVTLTLNDIAAGTLSVGTSGAVSATFAGGVWTASGAILDVNILLAGVTFNPALNYALDFSIATSVDDGTAPAVTGSKAFTATAVNDAPILTNGANIGYSEGTGASPFTAATFADVDSAGFDGGVLTFSIASGADGSETLRLGNISGVATTGSNVYVSGILVGAQAGGTSSTPLTVTFNSNATVVRVEAVYQALSIFAFSDNPATGVRNLEVVITDGDGGTSNIATSSANLVTIFNDDPSNSGTLPATVTVIEDLLTAINVSAITIADPDANSGSLTITLTTSTGGNISAAAGAGIIITGTGTNTITLSGSLADINSYIDDATKLSYLHGTTNTSGNSSDSIQVDVTDNGNTGDGGGGVITLGTITVDITPVNDAPTATNLNAAESYTEDSSLGLTNIVVSDVDSANVTVTLTLSDISAGSLSTGGSGSVVATFVGGVWTASGAIADVNVLLASVTFSPALNYNSDFSIATSVDDGTAPAVTGAKIFTAIAVNDAPTAINLNAAESYTEDTTLNLIDIVVMDIDSPNTTVTLSLSDIAAGSLSTATSGAVTSTFVGGIWTASGAIADVNALLAGVTFNPALNYNSNFSIVTSVDDGVAPAVTGIKAFSATATNDAPIAVNDRTALDFDGIDDYVLIADDPALVMTSTLTVEAWFKHDDSSGVGQNMIVNKEGEYEIAIYNGTIQWAIANVDPGWAWHNTGYTVVPDKWTHVAFTYDNGVASTFIDGVLVDTYNGSGVIGDSYPVLNDLVIGGRTNIPAGQYFDGQITDVRIWNVARSQLEISSNQGTVLTGAESGLVGYWLLDEGAGTIVLDRSIQENNGLLGGGVATQEPAWVDYTVPEDGTLNVLAPGVLTNDFDVDGDALTVNTTPVVDVSNGTLVLSSDGSFSYTPDADFNGIDSFSYEISDGNGGVDTAVVTINITPVNDVPIATNLNAAESYTEDTALNLTDIVVSDVDNTNTTVTLTLSDIAAGSLSTATSGAVTSTFVGGVWTASGVIADVNALLAGVTFTPVLNYNSNFSIVTSVDDGTAPAVMGAKIFTATAVNDVPVNSVPAAQFVNEDNSLIFSTANGNLIAVSDVDAAGNQIKVTLGIVDGASLVFSGAGGLTPFVWSTSPGIINYDLTGTTTQINAELDGLIFTPANNFNGVTVLRITTDDLGNVGGGNLIDIDNVSITVAAINDPAIIGGVDTGGVTEDLDPDFDTLLETSGLLTIADIDAGESSFTPGTIAGTYGALVIDAAGNWNYSADNTQLAIQSLTGGASLIDSISVTSFDGTSHNIVITISGVNDAPVAQNDSSPAIPAISEGNSAILDLSANDSDVDNAIDLSSIVITTAPLNGSLTINGDGTVTYLHNGSETVSDSFNYTISDITGAVSNIATVSLVINPVNDAPIAQNDNGLTVDEGAMANFDLAFNDSDADDGLDLNSINIINAPSNGILIVNGDGTVTYTHDGSNTLTDSFTYTIADISGVISNIATANIVVNSVNDAPTTVGISNVTVLEDASNTSIDLNVAFNDSDNPDNELTYSIVSNTNNALFSSTNIDLATGQLSLDYAADENGSSQITVRAIDPSGASVDTLFTVNVTPVDDASVVDTNNGALITEVSERTIDTSMLSAFDIDNALSEIIYTIVDQPDNGFILLDGVVTTNFTQADLVSNKVSYQVGLNPPGNDQFSFTVTAGSNTLSTMTFNIVISLVPIDTVEPVDPTIPEEPSEPADPETINPVKSVELPEGNPGLDVNDGPSVTGSSEQVSPPATPTPTSNTEGGEESEANLPVKQEVTDYNLNSSFDLKSASSLNDIQVKSIKALWVALDKMKEEINEHVTENMTDAELKAAVVSTSGVTLTAGVVAWVLRSGALMTSLISTIPLWKGYDPMPILLKQEEDEEEDELNKDKIPTSLSEVRRLKKLQEKMSNDNQVDTMFSGSESGEIR